MGHEGIGLSHRLGRALADQVDQRFPRAQRSR
jgi:hypothetical protein